MANPRRDALDLAFDKEGWAYDPDSKLYVRSKRALLLNQNLWVWAEPEPPPPEPPPTEAFSWPTERYAPYQFGTGSYIDAHPTRYDDVWREDVEQVARYLVTTYHCWVNTYVDHPPGWGLDAVSLDIWGPAYRGDPITESGHEGFWDIFNNGKPPWIRWCIRNGHIWDDYNGWRTYWDWDPWSDGGHWKHTHITFW